MKELRISQDLVLPIEAQTQTFVVYGGKGMGKTNLGSVLVEELAKLRLRFSVVDPLDVWWGLQHGATRDRQGLDVVILGGPHGDIPIEPTAGPVVADFVADEDASTVIVLRKTTGEMWTNGERIRFVADYCTRLFARQGERRVPLMQVVDEAGRFCPQTMPKGDVDIAKCVGAIEQLVEWGRNVGVGVCLITQRSARMNKSVSELAECMMAFRTVGPNSIDAVVDWFGEHVPQARQKELVEQLRQLDRGTALVVSPGWLKFEGVARIRERETFDSSSTPGQGKALRAPGQARKPDLEKYRTRMAETVEKAKAADPRELRKTITELQQQVRILQKRVEKKHDAVSAPKPEVSRPILKDAQVKRLDSAIDRARDMVAVLLKRHASQVDALSQRLQVVVTEVACLRDQIKAAVGTAAQNTPTPVRGAGRVPAATAGVAARPAPVVPRALVSRPPDFEDAEADVDVEDGSAPDRVLRALAQHGELDAKKLAILTGIKRSGSTYRGALAKGRNEGLIERGRLALTSAGREAMAGALPLPRGQELRSYWKRRLGSAAAGRVYRQLIAHWPNNWTAEDLAAAASSTDQPLVVSGSTWRGAMAKLRGLDLMPRGELRASNELFDE